MGRHRVARVRITIDATTREIDLGAAQLEAYVADHLGSTYLVRTHDGQAYQDRYLLHEPFGQDVEDFGATFEVPYRFTGQEKDRTGLYPLGARTFHPTLGRWLSPDPLFLWSPAKALESPREQNLYTYAGNNPVRFVDPSGTNLRDFLRMIHPRRSERPVRGDLGTFITGILAFMGGNPANAPKLGQQLQAPRSLLAEAGILFGGAAAAVGGAVAGQALQRLLGRSGRAGVAASPTKASTRPYSHLRDHPSVGPGKLFTAARKKKIFAENRRRNSGELRSDLTGTVLVKAKKHKKGEVPPSNEAQLDHIVSRKKGGSNSNSNAQVLSREENRKKGSE